MKKESIAWECAHCGHRHLWRWRRFDCEMAAVDERAFYCGNRKCKKTTYGMARRIGAEAWAVTEPSQIRYL